ncbi:MAG: hypothetical protein D6712_03260 [Chloroflexi bacterium]|nr:MAG: hypothetical protein D6712_03260 [Chloroflexota bacterium]
MTIHISWLLENRVMYVEAWGNVSIDDVSTSTLYMVDLIEKSEHPLVHIIIVNKGIDKIPLNVIQLQRATRPLLGHPKNGWHVFVNSQNTVIDYSMNILAQLFKTRWRKVSVLEEAITFLQDADQSLPPLPTDIPEPVRIFE